MKEKYKILFPNMNDIDKGLILSDDIDSLLSCYYLDWYNWQQIVGFYDFSKLYLINDYKYNGVIGVDIDLVEGTTWGNHTTYNYNPKSANINNLLKIGTDKPYKDKFCISTVLTIISYYNIPIDDYSEEGKMLLLAIDSSFKGYWFNKSLYTKYLKDFELDCLIPVLERHSKEEFNNIISKYKLNEKIKIKDDKLISNIELGDISKLLDIKLELPKIENLRTIFNFNKKYINTYEYNDFKSKYFIFSQAQTYKNSISLSYI